MTEEHCFIIMPFSPEFEGVHQCIKDTIETNFHYKPIRADEVHSPGNLHDQIINEIEKAKFVIADISNANPNVLYELGVSRGCTTPRIIICQSLHRVPSDLKGERFKIYQNRIGGEKLLKELIIESVNSLFPEAKRKTEEDVAEPIKPGKNLKINNTSSYSGDGRFDWEVHLEGPKEELDGVKEVIYHLHPTFPDPIRKKINREERFQLKSNGWGEFVMEVQIHYKTGEFETRKYLLNLD